MKVLNKRAVESLIKCGAFDSFGIHRSQLMHAYERIIDNIQTDRKYKIDGQISLFTTETLLGTPREEYPDIPEFEEGYRLTLEKEMLGLYITGHPLEKFRRVLEKSCSLNGGLIDHYEEMVEAGLRDGQRVTVGGIITGKKNLLTKKNQTMCFLSMEDLYGTIEVVVFPNVYTTYEYLLGTDNKLLIKGRLNLSEDQASSVICEEIVELERMEQKNRFQGVQISVENMSDQRIVQMKEVLQRYQGDKPIVLYSREEDKKYKASKALWVQESGEAVEALRQVMGQGNVEIIQ
jgi:DNA polymerase-3 subunit alpha